MFGITGAGYADYKVCAIKIWIFDFCFAHTSVSVYRTFKFLCSPDTMWGRHKNFYEQNHRSKALSKTKM